MGSYPDEDVNQEQDVPTYVASIPVPNVQEIVRENPSIVPERYIRNQEDMQKTTDKTSLCSDIPVIDLLSLSNGEEDELIKLDMACKEWGFFQVINHGVAEEVMNNMKDSAAKFFDLPLEEKDKYAMPSNDIQGYGHAYVVSEEQKLDWSDALILVVYPSRFRRPNFWPESPNQFKEIIEAYSAEVKRVGKELLGSISLIMGLEKNALFKMQKELVQALRINYYPSCSKPGQVLGLSPHSDTSTISILLQGENTDGLQIRHNEEWVPVRPIPNALIVNVGDIIEIWSDGKYKSIEHRAVINENKARISFASFIFPHDDAEIEPLDHLIDSSRPFSMYKKVRYGDFLRQSMKQRMQGKAHTEMAKN